MPKGVYKRKSKPTIERFMEKVVVNGDTQCWEWIGATNNKGYGMIKINGKPILTHRFAFEYFNNTKIPKGLCILHKCDNPKCVNYQHLRLGTYQDNDIDKVMKNRQWNQKLTAQDVIEIRNRMNLGDKILKIAKDYGVTNQNIYAIKNNKSWSHLNNN